MAHRPADQDDVEQMLRRFLRPGSFGAYQLAHYYETKNERHAVGRMYFDRQHEHAKRPKEIEHALFNEKYHHELAKETGDPFHEKKAKEHANIVLDLEDKQRKHPGEMANFERVHEAKLRPFLAREAVIPRLRLVSLGVMEPFRLPAGLN